MHIGITYAHTDICRCIHAYMNHTYTYIHMNNICNSVQMHMCLYCACIYMHNTCIYESEIPYEHIWTCRFTDVLIVFSILISLMVHILLSWFQLCPFLSGNPRLEVILFTLFISCPFPFNDCLSEFRGLKWFNQGASPCTLHAHYAHYAHFSKLAKPPKIERWSFDPERGDGIRPLKLRVIRSESVKLGRKGGVFNVWTKCACAQTKCTKSKCANSMHAI